jgi:hypothetical protein
MVHTALKSCVRFNEDGEKTLCISLPDTFLQAILSDPELSITISHGEVLDTLKRAASDPDLTEEQKQKIAELV